MILRVIIGVVEEKGAKPFQLHAGHAALELVNTLDDRFTPHAKELLAGYRDLLRFSEQLQLLNPGEAGRLATHVTEEEGRRVLAEVIELREALSSLFYGRIDGRRSSSQILEILRAHFRRAAGHRVLETEGQQWTWSWRGVEGDPEYPLWRLAHEAEELIVSPLAGLVKDCGVPTCRWLFLDTSKNHTRRWCSMQTCGNRMKARRFQSAKRVVH
jgi:predicted RNA-binding Zn ribbon-like protein